MYDLSVSADLVGEAQHVLRLDSSGKPACRDNRLVYQTITYLSRLADPAHFDRLVLRGFLGGAARRRAMVVVPNIRRLGPSTCQMGSHELEREHFCGETPRHRVRLSAFGMATTPVTNEIYACFSGNRADAPDAARRLPVVDVSWFDAAVCALWFGARLPTEAEWEYACGADSPAQWCCDDPADLPRHAWYSENALDTAHPVGTREPNRHGLWDMAGNVWEWCQDDYSSSFYGSHLATEDPVNDASQSSRPSDGSVHRVSRGGGFLALAEMCRTRYRMHDPAEFWAHDLGFRLAVSLDGTEARSDHTHSRGLAGESDLAGV